VSWEPLATSDPLPGDPGAIAGAAATLSLTAADLAGHAVTVAGIDPGSAFVGLAAERFDQMRLMSAVRLDAAGDRSAEAAAALLTWSAALAAAQEAGATALALAHRADDDRATARAGIDVRREFEAAASARADMLGTLFPGGRPDPEPWAGPDWDAALADAEADLATAESMLADAVAARDRDAATAATALSEATADDLTDTWLMSVIPWMGPTGGIGWLHRHDPTVQFLATSEGLVLNTAASWRYQAYVEAGIDPEAWAPDRGLEANDTTARAAWDYYRTLYESDPDRFQWAGLAWLAGATVYAGLQDLSVTTDALRSVAGDEEARDVLRGVLPDPVVDRLPTSRIHDVAEELDEIEAQMMGMQKQIFDDLAWQHVAYREGGLTTMAALTARDELAPRRFRTWRRLDADDDGTVADANRRLAYAEQHDVIGDDFTRLRKGHGVVGRGFTLATSAVAESPVPGGQPFREVVPYEVTARLDTPDRIPVVPDALDPWGNGVHVDTPDEVEAHLVDIPINDVSIFDNRWQWVEGDMLPAYERFVAAGGWADYADADFPAVARARRVVPDDVLAYRP
jgi:hypothetical protein